MGGYVRASALAPIRGCAEAMGARIDAILRAADLPAEILDRPDLALPLKDHYAVLDAAARLSGEAQFGALMAHDARIGMLGAYGGLSLAAPTLGEAIARTNRNLNGMMQTDTDLVLFRRRHGVRWSMVFHTRGGPGRYQNELLAIGYQLDLLRSFLGPRWSPDFIAVRPAGRKAVARLEDLLGSPVRQGDDVPGLDFGAELLATLNPRNPAAARDAQVFDPMPGQGDVAGQVRCAIRIELLQAAPRIDAVAARLGMSRRTLQRRLGHADTTFAALLDDERGHLAARLLADGRKVGEVSDRLGYSDHAHFTRAYRRWSGFTPARHRALLTGE